MEEMDTNDAMWGLVGITDIAFDECCLKCEAMRFDCVRDGMLLEMLSTDGISVQFLMNDDNTWTGHVAVVTKDRNEVVPRLEGLIDAIMEAKDLQGAQK